MKYPFKAFYGRKTCEVEAETSLEARNLAAKELQARKIYDVTVVRLDLPVNTASI